MWLWDIRRLLRSGDVERAAVESELLEVAACAECHDWATAELAELWRGRDDAARTA